MAKFSLRFRRKQLLHEAPFVVLEGGELAAVRGDQFIQGAEAVGDLLLLARLMPG